MLRSGATSYFEADGLGTITSLSNTAGALAQTYAFDSFGKQTGSSGSLVNAFQYTSREFDPESSLYYMRARYFDPLGLSAESGRKPQECGSDGYRDADPDDAAVVLQEAQSYQDVPYLNGAGDKSNYDGTDCSGLVYNAVRNSGINPSVGYSQANGIGNVSKNPGYRPLVNGEARMPGDVVVFPNPGGHGHVGFYDPINGLSDLLSATEHGGGRDIPFAGFNKKGTITPQFNRVRVPCNP